jgi:hypothetical protein
MRIALLLALLPACAFVPGSIIDAPHGPDTGAAQLNCLEVELSEVDDPRITFLVGNRCARPVGVDFRKVVVCSSGQQLPPYDPRSELHEAELDAHAHAQVTLLYPGPAQHFCVDVGGLEVDAPSPHPLDLCFEHRGHGWVQVAN